MIILVVLYFILKLYDIRQKLEVINWTITKIIDHNKVVLIKYQNNFLDLSNKTCNRLFY
jgi:hypothetical protein